MLTKKTSILGSIIWKASERISIQGLGLVVQIILARLLMPEDFALLAIIIAIINYFGIFVQCGLSTAVVQKKDLDTQDLSTLITSSFFIAFVIYIILFFSAPLISKFYDMGNLVIPIRVMSLSLFLYSFNSVQTGILTRNMNFKAIFYRSILTMPIAATVGIIMACNGYGVWSLIAYNLLGITLTVVFMNLMPEVRVRLGFSWRKAKEIYSFSGKILLTNLVSAGGDTLRTMTIGKFYNASKLAFYDRGYTYANLVTQVVSTSISSVMLPILSRSQDDISLMRNIARRAVSISAFLMIPTLILVSIMAKPLVLIILSEKWLQCSTYLSIFCLFRIPGIITSIDKQFYYALGKSQIGLYFEIGLLVANIIMLYVTVPKGIMAIAVGATIVEYLGNIVLIVISKGVYNYKYKDRIDDLGKPIFNSCIMAIVVYVLFIIVQNILLQLILGTIVGLLVYAFLSKITKDSNTDYVLKIFFRILNK